MRKPTLTEQFDDYAVTCDVAADSRRTRREFRELDAEIAKLQALVSEAREIISGFLQLVKPDDGAWFDLEVHKDEIERARAFLNRTGE